jgi:hypothetical protein
MDVVDRKAAAGRDLLNDGRVVGRALIVHHDDLDGDLGGDDLRGDGLEAKAQHPRALRRADGNGDPA